MYCTVYTTGNSSVIYINPNCNMKLIYEYLRVVTEIPDTKEIDLCTRGGRLLGIYEAPCFASGLQYLKPRGIYFIFTMDYVESTGDVFNLQSMLHYTNPDFEAVFGSIKMHFGIPSNEPIDDDDAALIYDHLLLAYKDKTQLISESNYSSPSKKSTPNGKSVATSGRRKTRMEPPSVLAQWRSEKLRETPLLQPEESVISTRRRSSIKIRPTIENEQKLEVGWAEEEEVHEEVHRDEAFFPPKPKQPQGKQEEKKATKKQKKKPGKDAKEDNKLLKTCSNAQHVALGAKPSFVVGLNHLLQIPQPGKGSDHKLRVLCGSKSTLFSKSDLHEPIEGPMGKPCDSIRQFFKEHPVDLGELPKPPVELKVSSCRLVPEGNKKKRLCLRKSGKLRKYLAGSKSTLTKFRKPHHK